MDKKQVILEKAEEMFACLGFDATSVRMLARESGVNLAMVSYYFGSKEKLFEKVIEYKSGMLLDDIQKINQEEGLGPEEKLEAIIECYIERIDENRNYFRILQRELFLDQRDKLHRKICEILDSNVSAITKIMEEGLRKGMFRKVEPEMVLSTISGTIQQAFKRDELRKSLRGETTRNERAALKQQLSNHLSEMLRGYLCVHVQSL